MHQNGDLFYQRQLADHFKRPLTTINYHITKFKREGLIEHHLELSEEGKKLFKFLWDNVGIKKLRAHNLQLKYNLIKCPVDYVKRYSRDIFSVVTNNKYRALKGKIKDVTFMFYSSKKIVCTIKDIYADTAEAISSAVQIIASQLKEILEKEFPGIKIGGFSFAKIQTSHIAVLDAILAEKFYLKGMTYEGNGLAIDKSHGRYEIEAVDPSNNLGDIMYLLNLEEKLRKKNKEDKNKE